MRRVFMKLLMLGMTVVATAQTDGLKPVEAGLLAVKEFGSQRVTRAASSRQGVKALIILEFKAVGKVASSRGLDAVEPADDGGVETIHW